MSALPAIAATDEQAIRTTLGTIWQVDHQVRSADEGDIDLFSNATQISDDWLHLGAEARVNLRYVANVWLTFGTIPAPDFRATLTGFDGCSISVVGEPVVGLQDELLKRARRR